MYTAMRNNFTRGQKCRMNEAYQDSFEEGEIVLFVEHYNETIGTLGVFTKLDGTERVEMYYSRCTPLEEPKDTDPKIGDRVRVMGACHSLATHVGRVGKLCALKDHVGDYGVDLADGSTCWTKAVELITEEELAKKTLEKIPKGTRYKVIESSHFFKKGDKVRRKDNPTKTDIVLSVPGDSDYDCMGFISASQGMRLKKDNWNWQKNWEHVPITKEKPYKEDVMGFAEMNGDYHLEIPDPVSYGWFRTPRSLLSPLPFVGKSGEVGQVNHQMAEFKEGDKVRAIRRGCSENVGEEGVYERGGRVRYRGGVLVCDTLDNWELISSKPKQGLMKKLTTLGKKFLDADIAKFVKLGWLNESLEVTETGRSAALEHYFSENKVELGKIAGVQLKELEKNEDN